MGSHKREFCKRALHRLTDDNLYVNASGFRECKACADERHRKWKDAHRERYQHAYRYPTRPAPPRERRPSQAKTNQAGT